MSERKNRTGKALGAVRLSCECTGPLTVIVVAGALACSRCAAALVAEVAPPSDLIDQYASPLGKVKHLRLVRAGELPATKAGKRVLVRREDLDAWLAAHAAAPTAKRAAPAPESGPRDTFADLLAELGATSTGGRP